MTITTCSLIIGHLGNTNVVAPDGTIVVLTHQGRMNCCEPPQMGNFNIVVIMVIENDLPILSTLL